MTLPKAETEGLLLYKVHRALEPIYAGGKCEALTVTLNNETQARYAIMMRVGSVFTLRDAASGTPIHSLAIDEDEEASGITTFTMRNAQTMVCVNTSNIIEVWDITLSSGSPVKSWKAHASPILVMKHHPSLPFLATGSADHGVRLWDSDKAYCTHNLKGVHGAIVTVLLFHPDPQVLQLFSASEDGSIAVWDLMQSRTIRVMKGSHVSAVTALEISKDGRWLLSAGRDKIVNIWDLLEKSSKPKYTVAVLESVEDACFVEGVKDHFITVGESGRVKVWDACGGECVKAGDIMTSPGHSITQMKKLDPSRLMITTSDLLVHLLDQESLLVEKTLVGHHGEITDATVFSNRFLALSTNSPEIRLYSHRLLEEEGESDAKGDKDGSSLLHCHILKGHKEAIVALDSNQDYLLSGSRDHSAILWGSKDDGTPNTEGLSPIAILSGHTDVVSAVALSDRRKDLAATASADTTLKLWHLDANSKNDSGKATLLWTVKAHDKDVNCITFTPNGKQIITTGQDKTIKIWRVEDGTLITTLSGHKRGVWHCALSPTEQLLASASADRTIRLWSLTENVCLRTLEGHSNSVLRVQFSKDGSRLVSAGSDGLVKIWDVRKGECLATLDAHNDRIWTMSLCSNNMLVTGDASGTVKIWRDVTEEEVLSKRVERNQLILNEQKLSNLIIRKDFENAVLLAVQLEQPQRLLQLFSQVVDGHQVAEGTTLLAGLIARLEKESISKLVGWVRDWNTSLKRAYIAQLVLNAVLKNSFASGRLETTVVETLSTHVQPYTERHFEKIDELLIGSHLADFILEKIKNLTASKFATDPPLQAQGMKPVPRHKIPLDPSKTLGKWLELSKTLPRKWPLEAFTVDDVSRHCTKDDCWVALNGLIFDITPYLEYHPGGWEILLEHAGQDITSPFSNQPNQRFPSPTQ